MTENEERRRAEVTELAHFHVEAQRRRSEQESGRAQELIDRFVERATLAGLPTEELAARPWSGRGRYRTGITGWYLLRNESVGVGSDGGYYLLTVAPVRFGRWRTVHVEPTPPPLVVGKGAGDGEVFDLDVLLRQRLEWPGPAQG